MAFGGVGLMYVILKNNKLMLSKRKNFEKTLGGFNSKSKRSYKFPKSKTYIAKVVR